MRRQDILTRSEEGKPRTQLYCVLDEAALRREVGNHQVMYEQLMTLADLDLPNVTVQIALGTLHAGTRGPFTIATMPDGSDVAYSEGAFGGALTASPQRSCDRECFVGVDSQRSSPCQHVERLHSEDREGALGTMSITEWRKSSRSSQSGGNVTVTENSQA